MPVRWWRLADICCSVPHSSSMGRIESLALSRPTVSKRIDVIATNLYETALSQLLQAKWFSLAIDETTDICDTAQLAVFVRFFNGHEFVDELLSLLPLEGLQSSQNIHGCAEHRHDKTGQSFPISISSGSDQFRFRSFPVTVISGSDHFRFRPLPVPTISGYHHKLMKI